jgi:imidazolonepropionase-like amidohydrolase
MFRSKIALALVLASSPLLAQNAATAPAQRTLVRAGHLLDVKTGQLLNDQTIVVTGSTIQSISPRSPSCPASLTCTPTSP